MADLIPDLSQAIRFLKALDPSADVRSLVCDYPDGFSFQTFDDAKGRKDPRLASVLHGELSTVSARLTKLNNYRAGIFVTINETDGQGRKLSNIVRVRAVWVEDDAGLGIELPLEPHLISETSPGKFHKIFLVDGLTHDQHQQVQKVLVEQYGSDPNAKDLARVLRVPGFYHCKEKAVMVRLIHESGAEPYSAAEILEAFKADPSAVIAKPTANTSISNTVSSSDDYTPISESEPLPDINATNAVFYLPDPGNQSYSEWRDVGMALHHQFRGSDVGLHLFDEWSQNVRAYQGFEDIEASWKAFGKRKEGPEITFRSLVQAHNAQKIEEKKIDFSVACDKGKKLIDKCDDANILLQDVAPKIWRLAGDNVAIEKEFIATLIRRYAELKPGLTLLRSEALKALKRKPQRDSGEEHSHRERMPTPDWADGWVWVSEPEIFFSIKKRSVVSYSAFKNHFSSKLPDDDGARDAARFVLDNDLIPKVFRTMYMPNCEPLFTHEGVECVNSCNMLHRAIIPDEIDNQEAVDIFKRHLELVCGGWNREAHILANWLALAGGNPPTKIRWSPLLIGAVGDGKSVFNEFMVAALGNTNCQTISSSLIMNSAQSGQSGWAEGACFGFIEELKWHGHNRYDAMNALKPYITNDIVPCRKLFKESITIPNTMNYFATSNYLDGAPLEEGDRRFFALQSQLDKAEIDREYFDRLFGAIRKDCGSILRWLVDIPFHADFRPNGEAPMTDTKQEIINMVSDDMPAIIMEIIEDDNAPEYCKEVILFDALYTRLTNSFSGVQLDNKRKLITTLSQMGYVSLSRVRVNGERHSLWVKREKGKLPSVDEAKAVIEKRFFESDKLDTEGSDIPAAGRQAGNQSRATH